MSQRDEAGVVAAVGIPGGLRSGVSDAQNVGVVRAGDEFIFLTTTLYAVWAMAFVPRPSGEIVLEADRSGIGDADELSSELLRLGLWARFHEDLETDRGTLERLRLHLVSMGLGEEEAGRFRLGNAQMQTYLELDIASYALVLMSNSSASLWDLCEQASSHLDESADTVAIRMLPIIPKLVQSGAAVLDLAR